MKRSTIVAAVAAIALLVTTACADSTEPSAADEDDAAAPADERTYSSTEFVVPLDVTPPDWLPAEPAADEPRFLTWLGEGSGLDRGVRFLVPVNVYEPGSSSTSAVPEDYLGYLHAQAEHGGQFADEVTTTVGGHPAKITTATSDTALDGSLGCQDDGMDAGDCFGLQPGLALRIAVVDVGGTTLLVWARTIEDSSDGAEVFGDFEQMLASLRFR